MKKIFIDSDYHCHTEDAKGRREVITNAFDAIADEAIKYYTYVPRGEVYNGVMCSDVFVQCNDTKLSDAVNAAVSCINAELVKAMAEAEYVTADRDALLDDIAALIEEVYEMDSEMMEE